MTSISDYQEFHLGQREITDVGPRMQAKMQAIPLPDLTGKSVLDLGCDNGFWCWLSKLNGATTVHGIDRNREVRNYGHVDFIYENRKTVRENDWLAGCSFGEMELGRQYHDLGRFDVVFLFSLYHHIFHATGGDHKPIWFWLRRQIKDDGELLWENPVSRDDPVVQHNVHRDFHPRYTRERILEAATEYFTYEYIGPALHEPTREVYRFRPRPQMRARIDGFVVRGHGGAKPAFEYANDRRCAEFRRVLGWWPYAGSINVKAAIDFPWGQNYYASKILDVVSRETGVTGQWEPRWARFYPLTVAGNTHGGEPRSAIQTVAFRFEGEEYPDRLVELIAAKNLGIDNVAIVADRGGYVDSVTGEPTPPITLELLK